MVIVGTGHRPQKLGGFGKQVQARLRSFAEDTLLGLEVTRLMSGLALGWDQALAHAARKLGIPWEAAIPFPGQDNMWPRQAQLEYRSLVESAAQVHMVGFDGYSVQKLLNRNEFMVDWLKQQSGETALVALWNGSPSGTSHCVDYATKQGVEVYNFWRDYQDYRMPAPNGGYSISGKVAK